MTLYSVFLFIHLLGIIGLFSAAVMMFKVGSRIRRASTVEEARIWLGFARTVAPFFPVSGLVILVTGLHMAGSHWSFSLPWVMVALVTVLIILPLGPLVQVPAFKAMGKAAMEASPGPVSSELRGALTDPRLWGFAYSAWAAALGLLWIMSQKVAGWGGATAPVVVLAALGAFLGVRAGRRDRHMG